MGLPTLAVRLRCSRHRVTCHFLGEDWEMKSLSLTTMPLEETIPQLVQNLKESTLSAEFETTPVKAFQASAAEQITEVWQGLYVFLPDVPNTALLAAALDPRFRKLKFLPAEKLLKVQNCMQSMAVAFKKESRQTYVRGREATATTSSATDTHTTGGSLQKSILESS